ncbi:MAG: hypothetical protein FWD49_01860 [Firmicutes bacterium]|nr:hypothetical protein [Bacillota bacterium]
MEYQLNQIYNEDCLSALKKIPDKYFELAIVDPPYGGGCGVGEGGRFAKYEPTHTHTHTVAWKGEFAVWGSV